MSELGFYHEDVLPPIRSSEIAEGEGRLVQVKAAVTLDVPQVDAVKHESIARFARACLCMIDFLTNRIRDRVIVSLVVRLVQAGRADDVEGGLLEAGVHDLSRCVFRHTLD